MLAAALVGLAGTGWKLPARADASFPVSLALSPVAMSFDDGLDVRDEFGRPVESAVARRELKQLFVSTVFEIMTRPELPQMAAILAALDKTWNFFLFALGRPLMQGWRSFVDLGLPSTRKGQAPPLAMFAAAAFCFAVLLFRFYDNSLRPGSFLRCLSSIVIRC